MKDVKGNVYKILFHCCYVYDGAFKETVVPMDEPLTGMTPLAVIRGAIALLNETKVSQIVLISTPTIIGYTMNGMPYVPTG